MTDHITPRLTRRKLIAYALQLSVGTLLAACTGTPFPQTSPEPQNTSTTGITATINPTITPKPATPTHLEGEIVVSVLNGSYKGWQTLAEAYTKQNSQVRVIVDLQKDNSTRERFYREQIASGAPRVSLANINTLSDLYAAQTFINWDQYLGISNPYTGEIWSKSFIPGCLDFGRSSPQEQFMLSTELFQVLGFYNRDLAKRLSLNPDKPPQTWDEMQNWIQTAANAGYVGIDLTAQGDAIDWLARIYADSWYTTTPYWERCNCQRGDPCFDASKLAFPSADWQTNAYFDDPDKVDFSPLRAWQAFEDGLFLGEQDESLNPMMEELRTVINKKTLPPDWRDGSRIDPLLFYSSQALFTCAGSWFIASCAQSVAELRAGKILNTASNATPTPDSRWTGIPNFSLGAFPLPRQDNPAIQVRYQRTIEQPAGFWGIPRKAQRQNELEVDFVMFITSPAIVALKMTTELAAENAEGNIIGISTVKDVAYTDLVQSSIGGLHPQGNNQKPHPLNMVIGGLPSDVGERRRLIADFYNETIDAESLKSEFRKLREASHDTELAAFS